MKVYEQTEFNVVRISFGPKDSMTFQDTTIDELYGIAYRMFSKLKINKTIKLKGNPFNKPTVDVSLVLSIREEKASLKAKGYKGKSRNKTMYGLTGPEAKKYFEDHYKEYL